MKTRAGTKNITSDNNEKAKELLKAIGIKPDSKVVVPVYTPAAQPAALPTTPSRPKPQAQVIQPEAQITLPESEKARKEAEEKAKKEAEDYLRSEPPAPALPPPASAGKGPPPPPSPPPPPPPPTIISEEDKAKQALSATSAKMLSELVDKIENDDPEERAKKKEASSKTQGTRDGKNLLDIKKQWINNTGHRDNYEKNLKNVLDDEKPTPENRTKAEDLLKKLDKQYKFDSSKDMPDPTTTTNIKIVEPRYKANEANKREYKRRGNKLLKKLGEILFQIKKMKEY